MSTVNEHQQTVAGSFEDADVTGQPQIAVCTPRISPPPPSSLSGSRSSLTLRPNSLWNGQNGTSSSRDVVVSPSRQSLASSLSPMSSLNRGEHVIPVPHSPNLSLILPATPGCSEQPAPVGHRAVMMIVERWVDACGGVDLDATPLIKKEIKDFLGKMASLGVEYRAWSHRVREKLKLEVSPNVVTADR